MMPSALSVRSNGHQSGISSKINEQGISKEWLQNVANLEENI